MGLKLRTLEVEDICGDTAHVALAERPEGNGVVVLQVSGNLWFDAVSARTLGEALIHMSKAVD